MNNFINNLVSRHTQPDLNIKPRAKARFESPSGVNDHLGLTFQENAVKVGADPTEGSTESRQVEKETDWNKKTIAPPKGILGSQKNQVVIHQTVKEVNQPKENPGLSATTGQVLANQNAPQNEIDPNLHFIQPMPAGVRDRLFQKDKSKQEIENETVRPVKNNLTHTDDMSSAIVPATNIANNNPLVEDLHFTDPMSFKKDLKQHQSAPVIKITIGRIDVQANIQKKEAAPKKRKVYQPKMSLQDYLNKRK